MGYALSWLAIQGRSRESVLKELHLVDTGKVEESPRSLFTSVSLPNDWLLLLIKKSGHKFIHPQTLQSLSSNAEIVACDVEEHVMASSASGWKNGALVWQITHNGEEGIEHLNIQGQPPSVFDSVRGRLYAMQMAEGGNEAEVDYIFDIPLETAEMLTGYRHDTSITPNLFAVLEIKK